MVRAWGFCGVDRTPKILAVDWRVCMEPQNFIRSELHFSMTVGTIQKCVGPTELGLVRINEVLCNLKLR